MVEVTVKLTYLHQGLGVVTGPLLEVATLWKALLT